MDFAKTWRRQELAMNPLINPPNKIVGGRLRAKKISLLQIVGGRLRAKKQPIKFAIWIGPSLIQ
jgi:hypothetical protein